MTARINASSSGLFTTSDTSSTIALQTGSTAGLTINASQQVTLNTTGAATIPSGTTAQRPATPINGMVRYNTDSNRFEGYINDAWITI